MYQALYRKYRPSTFDEVIGQNVIIKTLKNAIENNRMAHAYLFTGPRGTGKTSTAKILAKTINCEKLDNFKPCEQCISCELINNKQTTDIVEIDAASNNGVDEIRELKSKVNLAPSNSKYKIYIIDEVHMLSTGAFNALLKTLEEPPAHIIFILATTEPHKIPQTILSRCQRFDFKKISVNDIKYNLEKICKKEKINISNEALYEIAYLSNGGMRDSVGLLDQAIAYCGSDISISAIHEINGTVTVDEIYEIVNKMLEANVVDVLNLFDLYDSKGKNMIKLLEEIVEFLKNSMLYKIDENMFGDNDFKEMYQKIGQLLSKDCAIMYIKKIFSTISEMKNSDNEKIVLELNFIDLLMKNSNDSVKNTQKQNTEDKLVVDKVEVTKKDDSVFVNKYEPEKRIVIDDEVIKEKKEIRINNALALFDKKKLMLFKNEILKLRQALSSEEYSKYASLILDGELKVFGGNYLVFMYSDYAMVDLLNANLRFIDEMMKKYYNDDLRCIAVNIDEWNTIKTEFNSKKREYKYIEENIEKIVSSEKKIVDNNTIESLFNDIIEYSN